MNKIQILAEIMTSTVKLPGDFLLGAATSAYQIEGAVDTDGRGPSIWDTFCKQPGKIANNDNGNNACFHYHRFRDDVDILKYMSLDVYRFSISWSRVIPEGVGKVNPKGLAFYDQLIDNLLENDITPYVTLFHWDTPDALFKRQRGFISRQTSHDFAAYAETMARHFGDRVTNWITVNEPWEHSTFGHLFGNHAPGVRNPWHFWSAMHHILLGHGLASQAIRAEQGNAKIGPALSYTPIHTKNNRDVDKRAQMMADAFTNGIVFDPIFKGRYPEVLWRKLALFRPTVKEEDWNIIKTPNDFVGLNYYSREFVKGNHFVPIMNGLFSKRQPVDDPYKFTAMDWEIYPEGLADLLALMRDEYGNPPVYVTENGVAYYDQVNKGIVDDQPRISYLNNHLGKVVEAQQKGCDVRGYFAWSLLDNFEWAKGYDTRFGLVHVDFKTGKRTIKQSGHWLANLQNSRQ